LNADSQLGRKNPVHAVVVDYRQVWDLGPFNISQLCPSPESLLTPLTSFSSPLLRSSPCNLFLSDRRKILLKAFNFPKGDHDCSLIKEETRGCVRKCQPNKGRREVCSVCFGCSLPPRWRGVHVVLIKTAVAGGCDLVPGPVRWGWGPWWGVHVLPKKLCLEMIAILFNKGQEVSPPWRNAISTV